MAVRTNWQQVIGRVYLVCLLDRRQRHQMMYLDVVLGGRNLKTARQGDLVRRLYDTGIVLCCKKHRVKRPADARFCFYTVPVAHTQGHHTQRMDEMSAVKMLAIILIVAGALGLVYGGFTYTKETHEAKLGPIELSIKDKETVNVPVWAGVGAIVAGAVLLFVRK
jgi:hypothetical protein